MDDLVLYSVGLSLLLLLVLYGAGRVSYSIWWKPKLLERKLKQQGIKGTHYKVLLGDMKDYIRMITEAWSKPMNLTHQIVQRVDPFTLHVVQNYGKLYHSMSFIECNLFYLVRLSYLTMF